MTTLPKEKAVEMFSCYFRVTDLKPGKVFQKLGKYIPLCPSSELKVHMTHNRFDNTKEGLEEAKQFAYEQELKLLIEHVAEYLYTSKLKKIWHFLFMHKEYKAEKKELEQIIREIKLWYPCLMPVSYLPPTIEIQGVCLDKTKPVYICGISKDRPNEQADIVVDLPKNTYLYMSTERVLAYNIIEKHHYMHKYDVVMNISLTCFNDHVTLNSSWLEENNDEILIVAGDVINIKLFHTKEEAMSLFSLWTDTLLEGENYEDR